MCRRSVVVLTLAEVIVLVGRAPGVGVAIKKVRAWRSIVVVVVVSVRGAVVFFAAVHCHVSRSACISSAAVALTLVALCSSGTLRLQPHWHRQHRSGRPNAKNSITPALQMRALSTMNEAPAEVCPVKAPRSHVATSRRDSAAYLRVCVRAGGRACVNVGACVCARVCGWGGVDGGRGSMHVARQDLPISGQAYRPHAVEQQRSRT